MDQTENQKQQSLSQIIKPQFHRKLTQLLISASVFSLFFSHSYWLPLLHSLNFNLHNTIPFQLFSHTIDRNFIFLLCNGLLVFLAKYSGIGSISGDQSFESYEHVPQSESTALELKALLLEMEVALESAEALKNSAEMEGIQEVEQEEEDGEKWALMTSVEDEEEEKEEEEEEEENAAFFEEDEEELNKRFDEFIRKMKEELRLEAGQQLVMV